MKSFAILLLFVCLFGQSAAFVHKVDPAPKTQEQIKKEFNQIIVRVKAYDHFLDNLEY